MFENIEAELKIRYSYKNWVWIFSFFFFLALSASSMFLCVIQPGISSFLLRCISHKVLLTVDEE